MHVHKSDPSGYKRGRKWMEHNPANERRAVGTYPLYSVDRPCAVDEPNDHLKNMLTEEILHNFNNAGCPPHLLNLKQNDICIL